MEAAEGCPKIIFSQSGVRVRAGVTVVRHPPKLGVRVSTLHGFSTRSEGPPNRRSVIVSVEFFPCVAILVQHESGDFPRQFPPKRVVSRVCIDYGQVEVEVRPLLVGACITKRQAYNTKWMKYTAEVCIQRLRLLSRAWLLLRLQSSSI